MAVPNSQTEKLRRIQENLARVLDRIAEAARRSGRSPEQIRLVAVTKYVGPEEIRLLVQAGCGLLG
ncbi:MAG: YggS family pyridoxal phosphate-dependent enzyme, partial [Thermoguttaceae bacterium]|nr:YggS family pyridoxal phosphate-dependent enzyme [Thermoguttaceae bacterium]MDW8037738.1 YggS family pyridoxal phosphate-dependent enzyme [Thermoguttaceae bacterium]